MSAILASAASSRSIFIVDEGCISLLGQYCTECKEVRNEMLRGQLRKRLQGSKQGLFVTPGGLKALEGCDIPRPPTL